MKSTGTDNWILGICATFHDSTAALIRGPHIVAALEEERMTRAKHDAPLVPTNSILRLLGQAGISWSDISDVVLGWDYELYGFGEPGRSRGERFYAQLHETQALRMHCAVADIQRRDVYERNFERYKYSNAEGFIDRICEVTGSRHRPPLSFVRHHLAHAASAYHGSGKSSHVLIVVFDAYGDLETCSIWRGENGSLEPISTIPIPHSIGWVYAAITEYLGFKPLFSEGEVMGLAPYGKPRTDQEETLAAKLSGFMNKLIATKDGGRVEVEPEFIYFGEFGRQGSRFSSAAVRELSAIVPRREAHTYTIAPNEARDRPFAILAWALQNRVEDVASHIVRHYLCSDVRTRDIQMVALAGGVAYNIGIGRKLIEDGVLSSDQLIVPPACGDAGAALGAALIVAQRKYGCDLRKTISRADLGPTYTAAEIESALANSNLVEGRDYEVMDSEDDVAQCVARLIHAGNAVAWFQGGSEFGPRALGNRSILLNVLDPRSDEVANKIKRRQPWRPTAISVKREAAARYLVGFRPDASAPFMNVAFHVSSIGRSTFKAGVHPADNTTRPQTVDRVENGILWKLLNELEKLSGVPAVVNTSFNREEPIVETPEEALNTFCYMPQVKYLALGRYLIFSRDNVQPTILSAADEPVSAHLVGAERQDCEIEWKNVFSKLLGHENAHRIKVSLSSATDTAVLEWPLIKEFFDHRRDDLRNYLAQEIAWMARSMGAATMVVDTTARKYRQSVFEKLEEAMQLHLERRECNPINPNAAVFRICIAK